MVEQGVYIDGNGRRYNPHHCEVHPNAQQYYTGFTIEGQQPRMGTRHCTACDAERKQRETIADLVKRVEALEAALAAAGK